jgi:plastocyanin
MVAATGLVLAACSSSAAEPDANGRVVVTMTEFAFGPSDIKVAPGDTVTIVLMNKREKDLEFMIGRDVDTDEGDA